jgi:hypothetical protein
METLMTELSDIEMAQALTKLGVKEGSRLKPNDSGANLLALQNFMLTYFLPTDLIYFAIALLGAIHSFFRAKQLGDEEYRRYYFSTLMLRRNKRIHALPSCIQEVLGGVFILCGPSGSGKTSFFRQFIARLPKPFVLNNSPIPALPSLQGVWVFPVVHLFYPICGTVRGLVRDMREYFVGVINDARDGDEEHNDEPQLPDMLASEPENAAITACIAMNVGMVVLDGAGIRHSNWKTDAVLDFLLKLREKSGIPVVLSCTAAFLKSIEHHQTLYANLTNGTMLNLEPIPAPLPPPTKPMPDGKLPPDMDVFRQMCKSWWAAGLLGRKTPMPRGMEDWVYEISLGHNRFSATAFHAIHKHIATTSYADPKSPVPYKFDPNTLTKEVVQTVVRRNLFASQGALAAIGAANDVSVAEQDGKSSVVRQEVLNYVDYLPTSVIHKERIAAWVTPRKENPRSLRR